MFKVLSIIIVLSLLQCHSNNEQIYYSKELNTLGIYTDSTIFFINERDWIVNKFIFEKRNLAQIVEPTSITLLEDCIGNNIGPIVVNRSQNYLEITSTTDCLNRNLFNNKAIAKFEKFEYDVNWDSIKISSEFCDASKVFNYDLFKEKKYLGETQFGKNYPLTVKDEINILIKTKGKLIYKPSIFFDKSHSTPFTLQIYSNGRLFDSFEYDANFNPWLNSTTGLLGEFCKPNYE